ncbi:MAG: response regulator [Verrucomicrobia bacterium]|nr:response regulator [Verrucomicrobiota bacterium]
MASILIVDDTPENLTVLRDILTRDGHRVRPVLQGQQALASAAAEPPDLVLLDIMMPGLDGYETCERLRADPQTRDVPVLFISALDATESKVRGFEVGGLDYITKPFRTEEVLARVRTHLALREAQRQLAAQNAELRAAAALQADVDRMLRHDLRVSISGVIGFSELIAEELHPDHPCAGHARLVASAGYSMLSMVHGSFDLLKMERGCYALQPAVFDLAATARQVAAEHALAARQKEVRIRLEFGHGGEDVLASGERLLTHSLFHNLLRNAVEAAPEGGTITLTFDTDGRQATVCVRNPGEVPVGIRETFFEKFVTAGKPGGTGLGTYSARLMAETQRGGIRLDTSEPGYTSVIVTLPSPDASATAVFRAQRDQSEDEGSSEALPSALVLVADDDDANRAFLRRVLPSPPLDLRFAANGREALRILQQEPVAAAFLDLEMPELSGMELVRAFRAWQSRQPQARPPALIGLTGHQDEAAHARCLEAGFDRMLSKPVSKRGLLEELRRALAPAAAVVQLDPEIRDLVPEFLASQQTLLREAEEQAAAGDAGRLRSLAHRLQGTFAMYGFATASELASAAEDAAREGELERAAKHLGDLRAHLTAVEVRFG